MRRLVFALVSVAIASCGARGGSSPAQMTLTSDAFGAGQAIPRLYTCDGADRLPPLHWSDPPAGTKSLALVMADPDAPSGTFRHWGVVDIPPLAGSIGGDLRLGTEVKNDFGKPGYGGPCPPKRGGPHHYHFQLFALDVPTLNLGPKAGVADVEKAASNHAVGKGELVGTYERR